MSYPRVNCCNSLAMTWQLAIILQIVVSSAMTLYMRRISLSIRQVFFGVAVLSYAIIAVAGWMYAVIMSDNIQLPPRDIWWLLVIQGVAIPGSWLVQYRLIKYIGASNAVIVTTLNTLAAAAAGVMLLGEAIDWRFVLGAVMIVGGILMALGLRADTEHTASLPFSVKVLLALTGAGLFAVGMFAEKSSVDSIGAWQYMGFGWSMQAIGSLTLFALFGRSEIRHIDRSVMRRAGALGVLTSIAGGLYVYALSLGTLSQTVIATSGKAAVVMVFAALFLHERNALHIRLMAFVLTMCGLWLVLG